MERTIVFKKHFLNKLTKLLIYIEQEWGKQVSVNFLNTLDKRLKTLTSQPYIGKNVASIPNVKGILVTKHNRIYYKITDTEIIILTLKDTRMNPKKNRYQ